MNLQNSKTSYAHSKRYEWLDGLRGCAILFVVLFHSTQVLPKDTLLRSFFSFGQYGVQLFFVVSTLTCILTLKNTPIVDWYIRRFVRISLIYYFGMLLYYPIFYLEAMMGVKSDEFSKLYNIISNILFIHGWVPTANNNVVPGGWSIAVEMNFYLIAPFFIFLTFKIKKWIVWLNFFIVIFLLSLNQIYNSPVSNNSYEYFWPVNQLPVFFAVMGIYYFYNYYSSFRFFENHNPHYIKIMIGLLFIFIAIYLGVYGNINHVIAPTLIGCGFFIFIAGLGCFRKTLELNVLIYLGRISFSLYIVHFAFEHGIRFLLHSFEKSYDINLIGYLLSIFLILILSIISAHIIHVKIEGKYLVLSKKIINFKDNLFYSKVGNKSE